MNYDVTLRIDYCVGKGAASGRNILRMMPMQIAGEQEVLSSGLFVDPAPDERIESRDFFGNPTVEVNHRKSWSKLVLTMRAQVRRLQRRPMLDLSPALDYLDGDVRKVHSLDAGSPYHFTGASNRIPYVRAIHDYARGLMTPGITAFEAARVLNLALRKDMKYDAKATDVNTAASDAFSRRRGVCQDFSHIMITALRALGVPAAYVSGFLRTIPPEGKPRLAGADAMHAWVRVWCGYDLGWVEFDPTNGLIVNTDHIVVAFGRDYSDVSPVRGVLRTTGPQKTEQSVDVVPLA